MRKRLIKLIDNQRQGNTVFHEVDSIPPPGYTMDGTPWGPVEVVRWELPADTTTVYDGDLYVVPTTTRTEQGQ